MSDREGVSTATNSGGPLFSGELFIYEKVLELSENQGIDESSLIRPGPFIRDRSGRFHVPDPFAGRIAIFDSTGSYVGSFGAKGDGPGEFRFVELLGLRDEVLQVFDRLLQRTTLVTTNGVIVRIIRAPRGGIGLEGLYPIYDSGDVLEVRRINELSDPSGTTRRMAATRLTVTADTIFSVLSASVQEYYVVPAIPGAFSPSYEDIPLVGRSFFASMYGTGFSIGTGQSPVLEWFGEAGSLIHRIEVGLMPSPVTQEDRDTVAARFESEMERQSESLRAYTKWRQDHAIIPETTGYWDAVQIDEGGNVWLRVCELREHRAKVSGALFRLLSPQGEYIGDTRWPTMEGRVQGDLLLGLTWRESDGAYVPTVFRMRPAVTGLHWP